MSGLDAKEEIRRRLDIVEVVSQYVPLQRAGRRYKARCPFHTEKTPSFFVNPELGFWKCFGCGAAGDIFSFVMQIEGVTFGEAAQRLAERAGVPWRPARGLEKAAQERQAVLEANAAAAAWFRQRLFGPEGQPARAYLQGRGLSERIIKEFMLGFAPDDWEALTQYLRGRGVREATLIMAGLAKARSSGGCYDFFRNRIIFPVIDVAGRVIAFGGRALDPEEPAKYINSPDTPVFRKGAQVYGLNLAREAISRTRQAIVVEGYMDVIALRQAGVENVVACLGTATTEEHLRLLSRYADSLIFVYDADAAGMRAALRNITVFESAGAAARLAVLPPGQDPDECVRTEGVERFRQCVAEAMSFAEYEIAMAFERFDMTAPDGRLQAAREAVNTLLKVPEPTRREELLDRVALRWARGDPQRAAQLAQVLRLELRRRWAEQRGRRRPARSGRGQAHIIETLARTADGVPPGVQRLEKELLATALHEDKYAEPILSQLAPADFRDPLHQQLAQALWAQRWAEGFRAAEWVERFPEGSAERERAIELLLEDPEWTEEEFEAALARMKRHRKAAGLLPKCEIDGMEEEAEEEIHIPPAKTEGEEDFEAWRRRVAAAIDRGELTPDNPDYVRFIELSRRFRGAGRKGFVDQPGLTALSAATPDWAGDESPDEAKPEEEGGADAQKSGGAPEERS